MEPRASFSSLTAGLVQDILRHLDLKGQGQAACVSKLCAAAVLPLAPALAHYVTVGDAPAVRRLLQKPDARLGLDNPSCGYGKTPLLKAVVQDNAEIMAALLEAGAVIEARDTYGSTALIMCAAWGRVSMLTALLAAGAALEAELKNGWRALHHAAARGHGPVLAKLIAAGADLAATTNYGETAQQLAQAAGRSGAAAVFWRQEDKAGS